jgi:hypothetical protein
MSATATTNRDDHTIRSIAMHTMHEALARDRMRELEARSRSSQLARSLAAERRWHRVSRYASAAHARRASRLRQLTTSVD